MTDLPSVGILLLNLGTPDAPTASAVRRYLKEFLSDVRVVDMPRALWWIILNGIILNVRPAKSAAAYRKIWTDQGSPLLDTGLRQKQALETILQQRHGTQVTVALAMRYGQPSIHQGLAALHQAACRRVLILPLYPQYSATTTASTFDAVAATLKHTRNIPELHFVHDYHDHTTYIHALATSVRGQWAKHGEPEQLLISFHGIPERYQQAGDPYPEQCRYTATLLADTLGLDTSRWQLAFQSRFGREPWIRPYTDETLIRLAEQGMKRVDVICPGFSADCLETLEEISIRYQNTFMQAGGEVLRYIPALNDREDHILALADIVEQHCRAWFYGG